MACRHGPDPNSLFESAPGEFTLEETGDENVGLETDVRSNMLKDLMANRARLRLQVVASNLLTPFTLIAYFAYVSNPCLVSHLQYYKPLGLRHDHYFVTADFLTQPTAIRAQKVEYVIRYI